MFIALVLAVSACTPPPLPPIPTLPPTVAAPPTVATTPAPSTSTPEPIDTGWQALGGGLELRRLSVQVETLGDRLWLVRVDPAQANFRVLYDPAAQRTVRGWLDAAHPRLVVNGGYFTPEKSATALVVSDGVRSGQSYVGFGGMFAVHNGQVTVRSLAASPYSPAEPLEQAVQAFPMLVQSGGFQAVTEDDGKIARRTVVGQDRAGRIVFLQSSQPLFSLKTLSAFLAASDLDLDTAFNLDGGTSSGLWYIDQAGRPMGVDSWVYVPAVIVVE